MNELVLTRPEPGRRPRAVRAMSRIASVVRGARAENQDTQDLAQRLVEAHDVDLRFEGTLPRSPASSPPTTSATSIRS